MTGVPPLCRCWRVSEETIRKAIAERGLTTVEEVSALTRAATGCQSCYDDIAAILAGPKARPASAAAPVALSDAQARALIEKTVTGRVRPLFVLNGFDLELLDVNGDRAFFRYRGRGASEPRPGILTLKWWLVRIISDALGRRMQQVEMNVLEEHGAATLP